MYYLTYAVDVTLMLSNLVFLITAYKAFKQNEYLFAWHYFWATWASFLYHMCLSFNVCIFTPQTMHHIDFFFAQMTIVVAGLLFIYFSKRYKWVKTGLYMLGAILIVTLQATVTAQLYVQGAVVLLVFLLIIIYWIAYSQSRVGNGRIPPYNITMLRLGLLLSVGATSLYAGQEMDISMYWAIHSIWHMMAAMGQIYLLQMKPPLEKNTQINSRIK